MGDITKISFALATFGLALTCSAQTRFVPTDGDVVTIWRTIYGPQNHEMGKSQLLKALPPMLASDGLVRMTIVAENKATGEVVTLQFSDPYSVTAKNRLGPRLQPSLKLAQKPTSRTEMRIFGHNDEPHVPAVGDHLIFWVPNLKPGTQGAVKSHLVNRIITELKKDDQERDSYFLESDDSTQLLGVGISPPKHGRETALKPKFNAIRQHEATPVKVEHFRVIYVRHENRR